MADFEDMTGWREELKEWRATPEYKSTAKAYYAKQSAVYPYSIVAEYIALYMKNKECQEAFELLDAWHEKYPAESEEKDMADPGDALNPLGEFRHWYAYKKKLPFSASAFSAAHLLVEAIRDGRVPSLEAPEAKALLEDFNSSFIDYSK